MQKPVIRQEDTNEKGSARNQKAQNTYKQVMPLLNGIIMEEGIKREQVIDLIDFQEHHRQNHPALEEIRCAEIIRQPENNQCIFFTGNTAKVRQNEKEHWEYYSYNDKEFFYLGAHDILSAFSEKPKHEITTDIIKAYGFTTDEEERKRRNRAILIENICKIVKEIEMGLWEEKYPILHKLVAPSLPMLINMNKIAADNLKGDEFIVNNEAIFFTSAGYAAKKMDKGKTYAINHINYLVFLGFIRKLGIMELTERLRDRVEEERVKKKNGSYNNFYVVNQITDELLEEAEEMAKIAEEKSIKPKDTGIRGLRDKFNGDEEDEKKIREYMINRVYPHGRNRGLIEDLLKKNDERKGKNDKSEIVASGEYIEEDDIPF